MVKKKKTSILVVGFNTRPLVYSLNRYGYEVFAVDFFGDLDLYPHVADCLIITKELGSSYNLIKNEYSKFLVEFAVIMLEKYPHINYLILGSGLDDALEERTYLLNEINKKNYNIIYANNNNAVIKKARDILFLYEILRKNHIKVPYTYSASRLKEVERLLSYPFILKKKNSAGGINVHKINNNVELSFLLKRIKLKNFNPSEWILQEYIVGIPISCTTISNGVESLVITINRQIIGLDLLNPPKKFMYCGNVVPSNLMKSEEKLVADISLKLSKQLELKGINGFDFVLKNHYPYLMEINPRIPGSIRASECVLKLNLMDLHIKSFSESQWEDVKRKITQSKSDGFCTKLITFAPHQIDLESIRKVNNIKYVHDKPKPEKPLEKGEPICSILYKDATFAKSFFNALKIADKIKDIIR